jgi:hypothetical protein
VSTDGPRSEDGGNGARSDDNVVRLPRDWLGPREELVPFGPADAEGRDSRNGMPTADDFWGEESSAMQSVLETPARSSASARFAPRLRGGRSGAWSAARARIQLAAQRALSARRTILAVLTVAALVTLGITSALPGARKPAVPAGTNTAGQKTAQLRSVAGSALPPSIGYRPQAREHAGANHAVESAREKRARAGEGRTRFVALKRRTAHPVRYAAPLQTTPSSPSSTGSGPSSGSSTAAASSSRAASSSPRPAGPAGPGAPFGPGSLG